MKYQKMIVILMVVAIALIILGIFIPSNEPEEKIQIEFIEQGAMKLNILDEECLYKFNSTIKNKGERIEDAIFQIKMVKNNSVIELDEFSIGDLAVSETRLIEKNYTRSCDYLDSFKIDIKN